jgi:hypothetical protein
MVISLSVASSQKEFVLLPRVMMMMAFEHGEEDWRNKDITPRMILRAPNIPAYGMT